MSKSKSNRNGAIHYSFFQRPVNTATRLYNFQFWQTLDKAQQSRTAQGVEDATD